MYNALVITTCMLNNFIMRHFVFKWYIQYICIYVYILRDIDQLIWWKYDDGRVTGDTLGRFDRRSKIWRTGLNPADWKINMKLGKGLKPFSQKTCYYRYMYRYMYMYIQIYMHIWV